MFYVLDWIYGCFYENNVASIEMSQLLNIQFQLLKFNALAEDARPHSKAAAHPHNYCPTLFQKYPMFFLTFGLCSFLLVSVSIPTWFS